MASVSVDCDPVTFYGGGSPFSNFWKTTVPVRGPDDHLFNTSEAMFMYLKAKLFEPENKKALLAIVNAPTPLAAKQLGRRVAHFDEATWNVEREAAMFQVLIYKFSQVRNQLCLTNYTNQPQIVGPSRMCVFVGNWRPPIGRSVTQGLDLGCWYGACGLLGSIEARRQKDWIKFAWKDTGACSSTLAQNKLKLNWLSEGYYLRQIHNDTDTNNYQNGTANSNHVRQFPLCWMCHFV